MKASSGFAALAIRIALVACTGALVPLTAGAQTAPPPNGSLVVGGEVPTPLTLSAAQFKQLPRTTVVRKDQAGETKYEGVLVTELLKRAGAPLSQGMGRQTVAAYLVASAKDGYQAVFAIAEIDPVFTDSQIIVADMMDGQPLPDGQGPFRIVAPHDKGAARSVRMVQRLELVRLK